MIDKAELNENVGAVVVGHDSTFNFHKLFLASLYIQKKALFFAVNIDKFKNVNN